MKITVNYWLGTTQFTGHATTVRGALRIAAKNRNAFSVRFYDERGLAMAPMALPEGGCGLAYFDEETPENLRDVVYC